MTAITLYSHCYSQVIKLLDRPWPVGKEYINYGLNVKKLEGKPMIASEKTTILIEPRDQFVKRITEESEKEMWSMEKQQKYIQLIGESVTYGVLHLRITRSSIEAGNLKYFSVIIQDAAGNEVFRQELDSSIPTYLSNGVWYNYSFIPIDVELDKKYYVYIIDRINKNNPRYKFLVTTL